MQNQNGLGQPMQIQNNEELVKLIREQVLQAIKNGGGMEFGAPFNNNTGVNQNPSGGLSTQQGNETAGTIGGFAGGVVQEELVNQRAVAPVYSLEERAWLLYQDTGNGSRLIHDRT
jgi:hypothetical protein